MANPTLKEYKEFPMTIIKGIGFWLAGIGMIVGIFLFVVGVVVLPIVVIALIFKWVLGL